MTQISPLYSSSVFKIENNSKDTHKNQKTNINSKSDTLITSQKNEKNTGKKIGIGIAVAAGITAIAIASKAVYKHYIKSVNDIYFDRKGYLHRAFSKKDKELFTGTISYKTKDDNFLIKYKNGKVVRSIKNIGSKNRLIKEYYYYPIGTFDIVRQFQNGKAALSEFHNPFLEGTRIIYRNLDGRVIETEQEGLKIESVNIANAVKDSIDNSIRKYPLYKRHEKRLYAEYLADGTKRMFDKNGNLELAKLPNGAVKYFDKNKLVKSKTYPDGTQRIYSNLNNKVFDKIKTIVTEKNNKVLSYHVYKNFNEPKKFKLIKK